MQYKITIFGACAPYPRLLYWIASSISQGKKDDMSSKSGLWLSCRLYNKGWSSLPTLRWIVMYCRGKHTKLDRPYVMLIPMIHPQHNKCAFYIIIICIRAEHECAETDLHRNWNAHYVILLLKYILLSILTHTSIGELWSNIKNNDTSKRADGNSMAYGDRRFISEFIKVSPISLSWAE